MLLYFLFFRWICCIYLENSCVLNFDFGFNIEKTIHVYIPTHLVISFIWNQPSFTKCSRVRICFILLLQKMVSQNVCCEKLIFYLNWNHQHICKECSQTQNDHLLYRKLLQLWYFELQPDYVVSKYTPEFARTFVRLSVHVKTAVYQGMIMQTLVVYK